MGSDERQQVIAELAALRVEQFLAASVSTLVNMALLRLGAIPGGEGHRDLAQARTAIDAIGALEPFLAAMLPASAATELRQTLSDLRLEYAASAGGAAEPPRPGGGAAPPRPGGGAAPPPPRSDPPPPRPRIWTPRGEV